MHILMYRRLDTGKYLMQHSWFLRNSTLVIPLRYTYYLSRVIHFTVALFWKKSQKKIPLDSWKIRKFNLNRGTLLGWNFYLSRMSKVNLFLISQQSATRVELFWLFWHYFDCWEIRKFNLSTVILLRQKCRISTPAE